MLGGPTVRAMVGLSGAPAACFHAEEVVPPPLISAPGAASAPDDAPSAASSSIRSPTSWARSSSMPESRVR